MPATGVSLFSLEAAPGPKAFTARTRKKYSVPLVRLVTVWLASLVPPAPLSAMVVQSASAQVCPVDSFWQYSCRISALSLSSPWVQPSVTLVLPGVDVRSVGASGAVALVESSTCTSLPTTQDTLGLGDKDNVAVPVLETSDPDRETTGRRDAV